MLGRVNPKDVEIDYGSIDKCISATVVSKRNSLSGFSLKLEYNSL